MASPTPWADEKERELRANEAFVLRSRTTTMPHGCPCRETVLRYDQGDIIHRTVTVRDYCVPCREEKSGCFRWSVHIDMD